jgi:peroxiredoxin Q/BCP
MVWVLLVLGVSIVWLLISRVTGVRGVPAVGSPAPDFSLPDQHGQLHGLQRYAGSWVLLYFYPKDDTPGCTREACAFRDEYPELRALGAEVLGISVDNARSHAKFAEKYQLPFPLLADTRGAVAARYGVLLRFPLLKLTRRYSFLIDPLGIVRRVYDNVDTGHHAAETVADIKQLMGAAR